MPTDLRCPACGNTYADRWRCECGHPLDFVARPLPDGSAPAFTDLDTRQGLWAFADFLPVEREVSLGAGWTPIVDSEGLRSSESRPSAGDVPEWNATFKLEYVSPTGSFKDRGAATTIARAIECGADRVIEDSSGNAGTAIATYAARAGLESEIYVPADAKAAKLRAIERTGADVVRVEGTRADVTDAAIEAVENGVGWYASHAWNPAFFGHRDVRARTRRPMRLVGAGCGRLPARPRHPLFGCVPGVSRAPRGRLGREDAAATRCPGRRLRTDRR